MSDLMTDEQFKAGIDWMIEHAGEGEGYADLDWAAKCLEVLQRAQQNPNSMTVGRLVAANVERCKRWHPGFPDDDEWHAPDWSNAVVGEIGELAEVLEPMLMLTMMTVAGGRLANVCKKIRRVELGFANNGDPDYDELFAMAETETADIVHYATLIAGRLKFDLERALAVKFNIVSERQGFPDRLPVSSERGPMWMPCCRDCMNGPLTGGDLDVGLCGDCR